MMEDLSVPAPSSTAWHEMMEIVCQVANKLPTNADIFSAERVCKLWRETRVALPGKVQMQRLGAPQLAWLKRNAHRISYYTLTLKDSLKDTSDFESLLAESLGAFCAPDCLLRQLIIVQGAVVAAPDDSPPQWALPSCLGSLTDLQRLYLNCCSMSAVPADILTALCGLTDLELKSNHLECLPEVQQLSRLQRLAIQDCAKLVDIDDVGELTTLVTLMLGPCSELKRMPSLENLAPTLQRLEIVDCPSMVTWPHNVQKLEKLQVLTLRKTNVVFPDELRQVSTLTRLDLGNTGGIQPYYADARRFPYLASLTLRNYTMPRLPLKLGDVTKLTELMLDNCNLQQTAWGFADICHLQRLAIINAQRLHCLSEHMPEALTHLSIAGCPELQIRASVLERLSRLKQLSIEGCPSTYLFIPDSISCCMALTQLRIRGCPGLQRLPEELKNLSSLVELNITRCFNLNCLPSGFGPGNRSLRRLVLHDARCRRLPHSLAAATTLQELELIGLKKLEYLPDMSYFYHLTSLTVKKCFLLHQWPDSLAVVLLSRQLRHLTLAEMPFVNEIPPPEAIVGCLRHFKVQFFKPMRQPLPAPPPPQLAQAYRGSPTSSPFKASGKSPFGDAKPVDCSPEKYFARKLKLAEAADSPPQTAVQNGQSPNSPGRSCEPGWPDSPFRQPAWDAAEDPDRF